MEKTDKDVDAFLRGLEGPNGEAMRVVDGIIAPIMTGYSRVLWEGVFWGGTTQSIIGYGDLVQPRPRGKSVEWFHIGLAQQKDFVSLYVVVADENGPLGGQFAQALGKVKVGSSSIGFRKLEHIDLEALTRLVRRAREVLDTTHPTG